MNDKKAAHKHDKITRESSGARFCYFSYKFRFLSSFDFDNNLIEIINTS